MKYLKAILKFFIPFFKEYLKTPHYGTSYFGFIKFKLGLTTTYWPKVKTCLVGNPRNIFVGINSIVGRKCSYLQGQGSIYIGNYVQFGPNVGIVSANHDIYDQRRSINKPIKIGDYCWVGMGSIITAGVELGTRTIVGANSVVTKSFPDGYCVIAGNPAKVIKHLDKEKFIPWHDAEEFYGFIPKAEFEKQRKKYIDI